MIISTLIFITLVGPSQDTSRSSAEVLVRKILAGDGEAIYTLKKFRNKDRDFEIVRFWPQAKTKESRQRLVLALGKPVTPRGFKLLEFCAAQNSDSMLKVLSLRALHRFEEAKKVRIPSSAAPGYVERQEVP